MKTTIRLALIIAITFLTLTGCRKDRVSHQPSQPQPTVSPVRAHMSSMAQDGMSY